MNTIVHTLFTDAQENGDIIVINNNNESFRAYSFICTRMSVYIKSLFDFNDKSEKNVQKYPIELKLNYDIDCLKFIFEYMCFDNCSKPTLTCLQIVELWDIIEFLQLINCSLDNIKEYYLPEFKKNIDKESLLPLLTIVYNKDIYSCFDSILCDYFTNEFISDEKTMEDFDFMEFTREIDPILQKKLLKLTFDTIKYYGFINKIIIDKKNITSASSRVDYNTLNIVINSHSKESLNGLLINLNKLLFKQI